VRIIALTVGILLLMGIGIFIANSLIADSFNLTRTSTPQELILPPLPSDAVKVLSMNNSGIGVCVSYLTKSGEARMIQYTFSNGSYCAEFVYRFQPTK
jgi:hypothetical protein